MKKRINFTEADRTAARELKLFAENDSQLYFSTHVPFVKNYRKKLLKKIFDKKLALKGIRNNYVPRVVKSYQKQFGKFPVDRATKEILAGQLLKQVEEDIEEGVE